MISQNGAVKERYLNEIMQTGYVITSFGQDDAGELYLADYKGGIYRLAHAEAS